MPRRTIHFHVYRSESIYVAECVELPIVTQSASLDEIAENVREATSLHLEGEDLADLEIAPNPTIELTLEVPSVGQESTAGSNNPETQGLGDRNFASDIEASRKISSRFGNSTDIFH